MVVKSARRVMMETLKAKAKDVRNQRYYVKRGAIDWTSFDFSSRPYAIAMMIDDGGLLRASSGRGMKPARMSFEMAATLPVDQDDAEIDEGLLDEMIDDADAIVSHLITARDSSNDPVVFRVDENTARFVEWHDVSYKVQGIVVSFNVQY